MRSSASQWRASGLYLLGLRTFECHWQIWQGVLQRRLFDCCPSSLRHSGDQPQQKAHGTAGRFFKFRVSDRTTIRFFHNQASLRPLVRRPSWLVSFVRAVQKGKSHSPLDPKTLGPLFLKSQSPLLRPTIPVFSYANMFPQVSHNFPSITPPSVLFRLQSGPSPHPRLIRSCETDPLVLTPA